jgi:hypothetical protein
MGVTLMVDFIVKVGKKLEESGEEPPHILTVFGPGHKLPPRR